MNNVDLRKLDLNLLVVFEVLMVERSVTLAAARLSRTQSAVSHALSRLREQLGDPLLVKVSGRMSPSPYALALVDQVRPLLRGIERVLEPRAPFDAATSTRTFRVALPDFAVSLFPRIVQRAIAQAPQARFEWVAMLPHTLRDLAEKQLDMALLPSIIAAPEGVASSELPPVTWRCFMREGHPAIKQWSRKEWGRWPHVVVRVGDRLASPVDDFAVKHGIKRHICAWVPNFSAVQPLLAATDLIATLPGVTAGDSIHSAGLVTLRAPIKLPVMPLRLLYSAQMARDAEIMWLRSLVADVATGLIEEAERAPAFNGIRGGSKSKQNILVRKAI
jgi:DNA-binding transcriptional LysR family regulator